jgi:hypothetical protein
MEIVSPEKTKKIKKRTIARRTRLTRNPRFLVSEFRCCIQNPHYSVCDPRSNDRVTRRER